MSDFDLDIHNYTIGDIEKFFRFKPKSKYEAADVELRETQIREQLLKSGQINKRFKRDLIDFLDKAKTWLIAAKCKPTIQPTVIPSNYRLDNIDTPLLSNMPNAREHDLKQRDNTQFLYTNNSSYFPGKMNPLNTRVIQKYMTIDTRFRENIYTTKSSDVTIQLPEKLHKVVSMQLSALELPVSFYGISSAFGNNYFYVSAVYAPFDSSGLTPDMTNLLEDEQVFTIPDGNYNTIDLVDLINGMLSPVNIDTTLVNPNSVFSYLKFDLDITTSGSGTGKVTFTTKGDKASYIKYITLDFRRNINGEVDQTSITTRLGWNLGYIHALYINSTSYTADTLVEPASIRYIYLGIDDFNNSSNNQFITVFDKYTMNKNILARIAIKATYFSLMMQSDFNIITQPRKYFGPVDIQRLHIQLFDEHGRILDMNNGNYSFCLSFELLYDL